MFFNFGLKDLIDILLVAVILYYCYKVMKRSRSVNIFYGVLIFISFWIIVSKVLDMKLLGSILDQLVNVGAIALIVLFQEEIRHFFYDLGAHEKAYRLVRLFRAERKKTLGEEYRYDRDIIFPIVMACINMSKQKVGALIVLENDIPLTEEALKRVVELARVTFPVEVQTAADAAASALADGRAAADGNLADPVSLNRKAAGLMQRQELEEARLYMSVEANHRLLEKGVQIDTLPMEELIEEILTGKITDGKTQAAILKAAMLLEKQKPEGV